MNREEVIEGLQKIIKDGGMWKYHYHVAYLLSDATELLKEQPEIVRCKDCIHNGKVEKCVLAAIAAEKGFPLFMLDNRGEWFCADGKRR